MPPTGAKITHKKAPKAKGAKGEQFKFEIDDE